MKEKIELSKKANSITLLQEGISLLVSEYIYLKTKPNNQTMIPMNNYLLSTYFLKVIQSHKEIKRS